MIDIFLRAHYTGHNGLYLLMYQKLSVFVNILLADIQFILTGIYG